jgi:hypothetical protein
MVMSSWWEFVALRLILRNSRWSGGPSQEQIRREYLRFPMKGACSRLSESADALREVLVEIIKIQEEEARR